MKMSQCILAYLKQCLVENPTNYISNFIIKSDNCCGLCKSSLHFLGMQKLANTHQSHGISQHRKGKFDYVGGLAKSAIWRAIGTGEFSAGANTVVEHLQTKFDGHSDAAFYIKEMDELWV